MTHGFSISCEGIIGDGCGGGRLFVVENGLLEAHDVYSGDKVTLLKDIKEPISISKKACIITIECQNEVIRFDLSRLMAL